MKNNLFKLGMLIASMGVLVGCGGGNTTSSSSESKASESSSQSTGLSSSEEETTEEETTEEESTEDETTEEETTEEESTVEEESTEEETTEEESSSEEEETSEEEGTSEEEAFTGYSLIGDFGGHNWDYDLDMVYDEIEEMYVAEDVTFAIGNNWKIRVDHDWTVSYGYADLVISDDVDLQGCFVNADGNVNVAKSGTFDIYFDAETSKIYYDGELDAEQVEPEHEWGLIGLRGWDLPDNEIPFTKVDDGLYEIEPLELEEGNQFKVVADHSWTINFGYSALSYDADILEGFFHGAQDGNVVVDVGGIFSITLSYFGAGNPANGLYISLLD